MQRGRLFRTPLNARARLDYTRQILEWVYAENRSPQRLQADFWDWYCGIFHDRGPAKAQADLARIYRDTAHWNWSGIQRELRELLEKTFGAIDTPPPHPAMNVPRVLGTWTGSDGTRYLHYGPFLPVPLAQQHIALMAQDEILGDLSGLAFEALGKCQQCSHYFVRLRGTRKVFCSTKCTTRAFHGRRRSARERGHSAHALVAARKAKPAGRRRGGPRKKRTPGERR